MHCTEALELKEASERREGQVKLKTLNGTIKDEVKAGKLSYFMQGFAAGATGTGKVKNV